MAASRSAWEPVPAPSATPAAATRSRSSSPATASSAGVARSAVTAAPGSRSSDGCSATKGGRSRGDKRRHGRYRLLHEGQPTTKEAQVMAQVMVEAADGDRKR